jgi:hypothetical protein
MTDNWSITHLMYAAVIGATHAAELLFIKGANLMAHDER